MAKRAIKAGKAEVEIGIRSRIASGSKQVSADLKKLGGGIARTGRNILGLATAAAAPLAGMTLAFASAGDKLDKMSKRTGVSVKALSELAFAAEQSGSSIDSVEKGIRGMQRSLLNAEMGSKAASDALASIGLSANELSGMSPEDQFTAIADAIAKVQDPSKRAALAMQLFGRAGSELLPMLAENAEGIAELREEANELGRTMSEEDAKAAAELTDAMNRVKSTLIGTKNQIGAALAPAMTKLAGLISATTKTIVPFVKENKHLVQLFAAGIIAIGGLGAGLVTIGGLLIGAGMAVGAFGTLLGVLFSPLGLAIGGIAALGLALKKYTNIGGGAIEALRARFGPLVKDVGKAVGAIVAALQAGDMEKAWELTSDLIELVWIDMTEEIRSAWISMMKFILSTGDSIAIGIGKIFQGLATVLEGMMATYKTIYDGIYDSVLELGGDLTGVATIGATSSGFDANFGNVAAGAQAGIDSLNDFGVAMEEEAEGRRDERAKEKDARAEERKQRRDELGKQFTAEFEAAMAARGKTDDDDGGNGGDDDGGNGGDDDGGNGGDTNINVTGGSLPSPAEANRAGASGTFSAFGAAVMGMAPALQKVSDPALLNEQKKANEHLEQIEKKIKPQNRFQ